MPTSSVTSAWPAGECPIWPQRGAIKIRFLTTTFSCFSQWRKSSTDGKLFLYTLHRSNNIFGLEFPFFNRLDLKGRLAVGHFLPHSLEVIYFLLAVYWTSRVPDYLNDPWTKIKSEGLEVHICNYNPAMLWIIRVRTIQSGHCYMYCVTVETRYMCNKIFGTRKFCLLYQIFCDISSQ